MKPVKARTSGWPTTRKGALAYLDAVRRLGGKECEYGHLECAAWTGGPCADAVETEFQPEEEF